MVLQTNRNSGLETTIQLVADMSLSHHWYIGLAYVGRLNMKHFLFDKCRGKTGQWAWTIVGSRPENCLNFNVTYRNRLFSRLLVILAFTFWVTVKLFHKKGFFKFWGSMHVKTTETK